MKRTQIYLDDFVYDHLKKESEIRHLSISEVIRQSIREKLNRRVQKVLKATDKVSGIWAKREIDAEAHIRSLRKDRKI